MTERTEPPAPRMRFEALHPEASASTLELFFDLVFVFALTQITAFMAKEASTERLVQGMLVLGLLWWSWVGYAWLGNVVKADEGATRLALLVAMGAMFVIALAIPEAFDDSPGGISAPYAIATGYLVLRGVHLGAFWALAAGDRALRRQLVRFAVSALASTALLLVAAAASGDSRTWLWAGVALADYAGTYAGGASGWRLPAARHFAERHGLIVIVALGESIVAIGVGISDRPFSGAIMTASLLGLLLTAALWWLYFDTSALLAEQALAGLPDDERPRMGRDAYSFLHLPIVAGVVLLALGMKKVLEYVADAERYELSDPLSGAPLVALVLGVVVYLAGQAAFYYRACSTLKVFRVGLAAGLLPMLVLGPHLAAMATLAILAVAVALVVAWETHVFAVERHRLRHAPGHGTLPDAAIDADH